MGYPPPSPDAPFLELHDRHSTALLPMSNGAPPAASGTTCRRSDRVRRGRGVGSRGGVRRGLFACGASSPGARARQRRAGAGDESVVVPRRGVPEPFAHEARAVCRQAGGVDARAGLWSNAVRDRPRRMSRASVDALDGTPAAMVGHVGPSVIQRPVGGRCRHHRIYREGHGEAAVMCGCVDHRHEPFPVNDLEPAGVDEVISKARHREAPVGSG